MPATVASDATSEFDEYLETLLKSMPVDNQISLSDIDNSIRVVQTLGRLQRQSVWDIISANPKDIQPVCNVLSALPTTQVSVERLFSHLKLVMRENRAKLSPHVAEAVIFLRTN